MELDGGGDRVRSDVHMLQLLDHHLAVVGRVCQHQLNIYLLLEFLKLKKGTFFRKWTTTSKCVIIWPITDQ